MQGRRIAILIAFAAFLIVPVSRAATIEADAVSMLSPGSAFNGTLTLRFDRRILEDAQIKAFIDGSSIPSSVLDAEPYINGTYQFRQYAFTYNITASGRNEWKEYPQKNFQHIIEAQGTCGNQECALAGTCRCGGCPNPPPKYYPYSCIWAITNADIEASVKASDGLKNVYDGRNDIAPPEDANAGDTKWIQIWDTSQYGVQTTMRMACGSMDYWGFATSPNGWVKRSFVKSDTQVVQGGIKRRLLLGQSFDEASLGADRQKFVEGGCGEPYACGGIYEGTSRLTSGFVANGTTGVIDFDYLSITATYVIAYLPPNGPYLCAYTNSVLLNSSAWTGKITSSGTVAYNQPFSKTYTAAELPYKFNATNLITAVVKPPAYCPAYAAECNQTATSYSVAKDSDPSGGSISLSYSSPARTVSAYLLSPDLAKAYTKTIPLSDFEGLEAPSSLGDHTLLFSLQAAGSEIASTEFAFAVYQDDDKDGYCSAAGDCNDSNPNIHPGAKELCNGIDDDCDGLIDEDFMSAEKSPGTACGKGICKGVFACSPDGKDVICNGSAPTREICNNGKDDDCDGIIDEEYEQTSNGTGKACDACKAGDQKPCGSNVGACKAGYAVCANSDWSKTCYGKTGPFDEVVCNGIDDDCNGVIDDIFGGTSVHETKCGCYGGAQPTGETCDDVDNDCNGLTDDGVQCCSPGQTRSCGLNKGACRPGQQACKDGYWEMECKGGTRPSSEGEICYNNMDDDCDGQTDENCSPDFTCRNGKQDMNEQGVDCGGPCTQSCEISYGWVLFALGIILLIGVVAALELKGKI